MSSSDPSRLIPLPYMMSNSACWNGAAHLFFTTLTRVRLPTTSAPSLIDSMRRMSRRTELVELQRPTARRGLRRVVHHHAVDEVVVAALDLDVEAVDRCRVGGFGLDRLDRHAAPARVASRGEHRLDREAPAEASAAACTAIDGWTNGATSAWSLAVSCRREHRSTALAAHPLSTSFGRDAPRVGQVRRRADAECRLASPRRRSRSAAAARRVRSCSPLDRAA